MPAVPAYIPSPLNEEDLARVRMDPPDSRLPAAGNPAAEERLPHVALFGIQALFFCRIRQVAASFLGNHGRWVIRASQILGR